MSNLMWYTLQDSQIVRQSDDVYVAGRPDSLARGSHSWQTGDRGGAAGQGL